MLSTLLRKIFVTAACAVGIACVAQPVPPKREMRAAWMHTVFQDQYLKQNTAQNQEYLRQQLDKLQAAGVNAIIFQVRPSADAFYDSSHEPWSRFLTGGDGKAPVPYWDPLAFMIAECHVRGMELHAWLNPYRVTTSKNEKLPKGHIYHKHPERFVKFDGKLFFDPGQPENRRFIEDVVLDIVTRYDIDGIHFDDYFYPYPVKGQTFNDDKSYKKYGKGMKRDDWRRQNVDLLIKELNAGIKEAKPWVRFGISPFGIWRNQSSDPRGSDTNGLQNYDDLYADVILWAKEGWIDYQLPQLYWALENPRASSLKLVDWWNDNAYDRHVYIGQDIKVTMTKPDLAPADNPTQLDHKIALTRQLPNIQGNCWWPGYQITSNLGGIADSLAMNQQRTLALPPTYPWISNEIPEKPLAPSLVGNQLSWQASEPAGLTNDPVRFVVYQFFPDEINDITDPEAIVAVTSFKTVTFPEPLPSGTVLMVTALNRVNVESAPSVLLVP